MASAIINSRPPHKLFSLSEPHDQQGIFMRYLQQAFSRGTGISTVKLEGREITVISADSSLFEWRYYAIARSPEFTRKIAKFRNYLLWEFIALFFAGLLVSLLMTIKVYRPIRLAAMRAGEIDNSNELDFIVQSIERYKQIEQEEWITRVAKTRGAYNQTIISLVKGDIEEYIYKDIALYTGKYFLGDRFVPVCALIDNYTGGSDVQEKYSGKIDEYAGTVTDGDIVVHIARPLDASIVIILCNLKDGIGENNVLEFLERLRNYLAAQKASMTFGVGPVVDSYEDIPQAYMKAVSAAKYRMILGKNRLITCRDLNSRTWNTNERSTDNIVQVILSGDDEKAEKLIEDSFNGEESELTPEDALNEYRRFLRIIANITKVRYERQIPLLETLEAGIPETKAEAVDNLKKVLAVLMKQIREERESKNTSIRDRALQFLEDRYKDPMLNIDQVAEYSGCNPAYLSRYFKDQMGITLSVWLDRRRIGEAKRLLGGTGMTIKEVVGAAGYNDVGNFIKKFKRLTGVTPGTFKKTQCGDRRHQKPGNVK
jgi:AraC-like DNA-binding protein